MSSSSPAGGGREQLVGQYQPALGGDVARVFVLDEAAELVLVASGEIEEPVADVTSVACWDAVLSSLGFVRTSSWSRFKRAMLCTVERATHPG